VPVQFEAAVRVQDELIRVETENISLNGMLCRPDRRFKAEDRGEARIVLGPEAVIHAEIRILRSDEEGMAIAFTAVEEDSFFHLKKLVQYNTEDADIIDGELRKAGF